MCLKVRLVKNIIAANKSVWKVRRRESDYCVGDVIMGDELLINIIHINNVENKLLHFLIH